MPFNWRIEIRINFLPFAFLSIEHLAKREKRKRGNQQL